MACDLDRQRKRNRRDFRTAIKPADGIGLAGWLAHWLEQIKDNKLFRPDQIYEGSHGRVYVPIDRRLGGL